MTVTTSLESREHIVGVSHARLELLKLLVLELNLGSLSWDISVSDRNYNRCSGNINRCISNNSLWLLRGVNLGPDSCDLCFSGCHFLFILIHSPSVCKCVGRANALLSHSASI